MRELGDRQWAWAGLLIMVAAAALGAYTHDLGRRIGVMLSADAWTLLVMSAGYGVGFGFGLGVLAAHLVARRLRLSGGLRDG